MTMQTDPLEGQMPQGTGERTCLKHGWEWFPEGTPCPSCTKEDLKNDDSEYIEDGDDDDGPVPVLVTDPSQPTKIIIMIAAMMIAVVFGLKIIYLLQEIADKMF